MTRLEHWVLTQMAESEARRKKWREAPILLNGNNNGNNDGAIVAKIYLRGKYSSSRTF